MVCLWVVILGVLFLFFFFFSASGLAHLLNLCNVLVSLALYIAPVRGVCGSHDFRITGFGL